MGGARLERRHQQRYPLAAIDVVGDNWTRELQHVDQHERDRT
ncbi:hypothetical protein [Jiangella sp. DSM 45060]|nr:hypothetical protein [Jiangella sp. DSM 45060]